MRPLLLKIGLLATLAGGFCYHSLARPDLNSDLFPGITNYSDTDLQLNGIARLYPDRVRFTSPERKSASQRPTATAVEKLPRDITYIRIYRLEEAFANSDIYAETAALILDLRYVHSNSIGAGLAALFPEKEDLKIVNHLGNIPNSVESEISSKLHVSQKREHPIIVLVNRHTAGPFEATLSNLQSEGLAIVVGEKTAGSTGFYKKINPSTWILDGEVLPTKGTSIVGIGLSPRITLETNPKSCYLSYQLYEAGTPLEKILGKSTVKKTTPEDEGTDAPILSDPALKRGLETIEAMKVLGTLPEA